MAITSADIKFRLSAAAGPGLSSASTPAASLGGFVSTTDMAPGTNTLFDDISGNENANSVVDYRCFFVYNDHDTLTLQNAVIWMSAEVAGGANIPIAADNIGPVADNSASPQAATIASETTAPTGVGAFQSPPISGVGVGLGNIGPNQVKAVWVRRTATNSPAITGDGVTFSVQGDTAA